jgi:isopentenyl-diphosphate delta-isomerase
MDNGIAENEMCPVVAARIDADPSPDPAEVGDTRWIDWAELCEAIATDRIELSPWCTWQVRQLTALGVPPDRWRPAPPADLPPVAHPQREIVGGAGEGG